MEPDEARARLLTMQERISRDPYDALGLTGSPDAAQIRAAFLAATKQFHPAKFARMPQDVQKLANEVFLALRAAHDTLSRPTVNARPSGSIPIVSAARGTGPIPTSRAIPTPVAAQTTQPLRPLAAASAAPRAPMATRPASPSPVSPAPTTPATSPVTPPATPRTAATPPARASSTRLPIVGRIATTRSPAPGSTATSATSAKRPSGTFPAISPPATAAKRPSGTFPAISSPASSAQRPSGAYPVVTPPGAGAEAPGQTAGDPDVAPILALLSQHQFAAARAALEVLVASAPNGPHATRYRALLAYAKGREAQLAKRLDEARVELMDALALDPDLQLAKVALAELFTRRK